MIIVGFGKAYHDSSVCANINGVVKYAKYERETSYKHARAPENWYWKKLIQWGIDLDKIDMIVETDSGYYVDKQKYEKLPYDGISYIEYHKNEDKYHKIAKTKHILLDHHLAHAWSHTEFTSGMQAFVLDGIGSGGHTSMTYSNGVKQRTKDYSPGTCLASIGGKIALGKGAHIDNAGKVMGLVPYGIPNRAVFNMFYKKVPKILPTLIDQYNFGGAIPSEQDKEILSMISTLNELCYKVIEDKISSLDKNKPVIYSGGNALNVDWNRRLLDSGYDLKIQPHVYDGGLSIGCMRYGVNYLKEKQPEFNNFPYIQDDVSPASQPSDKTIAKVADLLSQGKIVGWYQGNGELGPRALGNRSILMDPTIKDGKQILNERVKHREWFRPFGASVKQEEAHKHFDLSENPFMLFTSKVIDGNLAAVTHVDNTCRHQTVTQKQNESFYRLLDKFHSLKGIPVLLNTSLNIGGNPIAGDPSDAVTLLKTTDMDAVCIGDEIILK